MMSTSQTIGATRSSLAAGDAHEHLGPYRILDELGEGGMARVFRAEHTLIGRVVAIKTLNPEVASDPSVRSRFFMEARIVNEIHHPNIVEVTDFGTSAEQPFIVMEYLQGETLSARVHHDGALQEATAIRIARQIASALGAVHERGIVHRDLKPDNVFLSNHLDYPDFVKILDFGIAKFLQTDQASKQHTQLGTVVGTPAYMSPEQCLGDIGLDLRSDIYSLGVVLFQMVTGHPPFQSEGIGRLMLAHIQDPPPSAGVSAGLDAVIERALAKNPADRFASMREMRDALGALMETPSVPKILALRPPTTVLPPAKAPLTLARTPIDPAARTTIDPAPRLATRLADLVAARVEAFEPPALTPLQAAALAMAQSSGFSFPAALDLLRADARLGNLVVRMANLEPYGGRAPAIGVAQAISRLGALGVAQAVIEQAARPHIEGATARASLLFRRPWQHALASALIARRLTHAALPKHEPAYAYLTGLLRDIGRPLAAGLVDDIERAARFDRTRGRQALSDAIVLEMVEAHHQTLAERVARAWGLPPAVIAALSPDSVTPIGASLEMVARLAGALADTEMFYLRREDLDHAEATIAATRAPLRLDEATVTEARRRVREWVAARG